MRIAILSFACLALSFGLTAVAPAQAQTDATPVQAPAKPPAKLNFTLDTPVEQIFANPRGKAVLDKIFPAMYTHEAYDQFKGLSLNELLPLAGGAITAEQLKQAEAELKKLDE